MEGVQGGSICVSHFITSRNRTVHAIRRRESANHVRNICTSVSLEYGPSPVELFMPSAYVHTTDSNSHFFYFFCLFSFFFFLLFHCLSFVPSFFPYISFSFGQKTVPLPVARKLGFQIEIRQIQRSRAKRDKRQRNSSTKRYGTSGNGWIPSSYAGRA